MSHLLCVRCWKKCWYFAMWDVLLCPISQMKRLTYTKFSLLFQQHKLEVAQLGPTSSVTPLLTVTSYKCTL
jgi:hypothetical protein